MSIEAIMTDTLESVFNPQILQVMNESHQHQLAQLDTHFKIILVCNQFSSLSRLARHRAVYQTLTPWLKPLGPIHALALHTYSPQEWLPACHQWIKSTPCANRSVKKNIVPFS